MLGFVAFMAVVTFIVDILISKKYNIFSERLYRHVNHTHKRIENTLFIIFIIVVLIAAFSFSYKTIFLLTYGFFTIMASIRAFMDYNYGIKEEKQYISDFVWAIGFCVTFIGLVFLAI
ncbi:DUF4181 domain-containing protein [Evansella cellulosilytica]|uniref:DUF4181 domain-containing protein n=1 Tax=Evansella cellulosilytica (strain ATCC 21833 / DSM 2522 / FERM P-1141 / JCM 9156 / N-4) TaxID=649639 RepID=E6TVN6_EVAC2|nr:DUF4181 domain-containing protein [Evansella cellulosilytica]ADU32164.1 hypothetical protein Bcell_3929 [Evansella cellulosilytica DSM 2522]